MNDTPAHEDRQLEVVHFCEWCGEPERLNDTEWGWLCGDCASSAENEINPEDAAANAEAELAEREAEWRCSR